MSGGERENGYDKQKDDEYGKETLKERRGEKDGLVFNLPKKPRTYICRDFLIRE
jgi:hypothetical protein